MIDPNDLEDIVEVFGEPGHTLKADGYDHCVIGIDSKHRLVYSIEKTLETLEKDMPIEEATEFFYYNIEGAYAGEYTPLFIHQEL